MPPRDRAGADGRVHFVDEQNGFRPRAERGDDRLEALLEVAAVPRARQQRARIECENLRVRERSLRTVVQQPRGQPFGHGGLANAWIAHEYGVVLAAAAEHFDCSLQLVAASNEWIE